MMSVTNTVMGQYSDTLFINYEQYRALPMFELWSAVYQIFNGPPPDGHYVVYVDEVSSGIKCCEASFKNGLLEGTYKSFWEPDIVQDEYEYHQGKKHGSCKSYNMKGKLTIEEHYRNGVWHGYVKVYHKRGHLNGIFECNNGKCGNITRYNRRGRVVSIITRGPDNKRVSQQYFNKKGIMVKEVFFHDKH